MGAPHTPVDLSDWMKSVAKRLAALEAASRSRPALTTVDGDLVVGGSVHSPDFDGTGPLAPGTAGWWLGGEQGDAILNSLILRDGIIGNDALTNPVVPGAVNDTETAFAISASFAEVAGVNATVPANCTRLLAMASSWCFGINPNTAADNLHARTVIGGVSGQSFVMGLTGSGGYTTVGSGLAQSLTGLTPGSTIRLACQAHGDHAFASQPTNTATVSAILVWLR